MVDISSGNDRLEQVRRKGSEKVRKIRKFGMSFKKRSILVDM